MPWLLRADTKRGAGAEARLGDGSGLSGPASSKVRGTLTRAHYHAYVMVSGTSPEATTMKLAGSQVGQGTWTLILAIDSRPNVIITELLSVVIIQSHPSSLRFYRSRFSSSSRSRGFEVSLPSSVLPGGPSTLQAHTTLQCTTLPARPTSHVPAHLAVSSSPTYIVQLLISTTASNKNPQPPPVSCGVGHLSAVHTR